MSSTHLLQAADRAGDQWFAQILRRHAGHVAVADRSVPQYDRAKVQRAYDEMRAEIAAEQTHQSYEENGNGH